MLLGQHHSDQTHQRAGLGSLPVFPSRRGRAARQPPLRQKEPALKLHASAPGSCYGGVKSALRFSGYNTTTIELHPRTNTAFLPMTVAAHSAQKSPHDFSCSTRPKDYAFRAEEKSDDEAPEVERVEDNDTTMSAQPRYGRACAELPTRHPAPRRRSHLPQHQPLQ